MIVFEHITQSPEERAVRARIAARCAALRAEAEAARQVRAAGERRSIVVSPGADPGARRGRARVVAPPPAERPHRADAPSLFRALRPGDVIVKPPTTTTPTAARWFAMPAAIKAKLARLETRKDALHGACESLRSRLLAFRAELSEKTQRLKYALANASPETRVGVTGSDPWTGRSGSGVATYGGVPGPERQQEIDRLAEQLGRLDVLYRAAQERWQCAARIYQSCRDWLEATEIAALVPVVVKYERLADSRAEVEATRTQIAALAQEAEA